MEATEHVVIDAMSYANGTAVAEVEVDSETGAVALRNFVIAHDCGRVIHPQIVEGQILGGVAHGIGNTLFERMAFDADAQPLTTTLADYLLVTATDMPPDHARPPGDADAAQSARHQGRRRSRHFADRRRHRLRDRGCARTFRRADCADADLAGGNLGDDCHLSPRAGRGRPAKRDG